MVSLPSPENVDHNNVIIVHVLVASTAGVPEEQTFNIFAGTASNATICLDPNILHYSEITLTGSYSSTPVFLSKASSMISPGKVKVKPLITHKFKLGKIKQGFRVAENYLGLKAIINT